MKQRPSKTRKETAPNASRNEPTELSLRLHSSAERLVALMNERDRLLRDVQKKKLEIEQTIEKTKRATAKLMAQIAPIVARYHELSTQLKQLFDELLAPKRLSAKARKHVVRVQRMLVEDGLMEGKLDEPEEVRVEDFDVEDFNDQAAGSSQRDGSRRRPSGHGAKREAPEVQAAAPRGQAAGNESLKALFKRLALAMHPDRAGHEADRERLTEAMKQITQAYDSGDFARLLELEAQWAQGTNSQSATDDEARSKEIEKTIKELRAQFADLLREQREAKKEARSMRQYQLTGLTVLEAKHDLRRMEKLVRFIKDFRDGKISLSDFIHGPIPDEEDLRAMQALLMNER